MRERLGWNRYFGSAESLIECSQWDVDGPKTGVPSGTVLLHEHPRNGTDFTVRPVLADNHPLSLNARARRHALAVFMATISLPRGRSIEVIATVNAELHQQVEISGPEVDHKWEGAGEGNRIGHTTISFPPGGEDVDVEVKVSYSPGDGTWSPSHEKVTEQRESGEVHVIAEDGRGALDGNDLIVRFRWVV